MRNLATMVGEIRRYAEGEIKNNPHLHLDLRKHRWVLTNPSLDEMRAQRHPFIATVAPGHPLHEAASRARHAEQDGWLDYHRQTLGADDMAPKTPEEAEAMVAGGRPADAPALYESSLTNPLKGHLHLRLSDGRVVAQPVSLEGGAALAEGSPPAQTYHPAHLTQLHTDNMDDKPELDSGTMPQRRTLHIAVENHYRRERSLRLIGENPEDEDGNRMHAHGQHDRVTDLHHTERADFAEYLDALRAAHPHPQVAENLDALEAHFQALRQKADRGEGQKNLYPGHSKDPPTPWTASKGKVDQWTQKLDAEVEAGIAGTKRRHRFTWDRTSSLYLPGNMPEGRVGEMWHGTSAAVGDAIQETGFLVPEVAPHGRALGNGVYLSHQFEKSVQYPFDRRYGENPETSMLRVAYPLDAMPHLGTPAQLEAYVRRLGDALGDEPALGPHLERVSRAITESERDAGTLMHLLQPASEEERAALHRVGIKGFSLPPTFTYKGGRPVTLRVSNPLVRSLAAQAVGAGLVGAAFDPSKVYSSDRTVKRVARGYGQKVQARIPIHMKRADAHAVRNFFTEVPGPSQPLGGFLGQEAVWHGDPQELKIVAHFKGIRRHD